MKTNIKILLQYYSQEFDIHHNNFLAAMCDFLENFHPWSGTKIESFDTLVQEKISYWPYFKEYNINALYLIAVANRLGLLEKEDPEVLSDLKQAMPNAGYFSMALATIINKPNEKHLTDLLKRKLAPEIYLILGNLDILTDDNVKLLQKTYWDQVVFDGLIKNSKRLAQAKSKYFPTINFPKNIFELLYQTVQKNPNCTFGDAFYKLTKLFHKTNTLNEDNLKHILNILIANSGSLNPIPAGVDDVLSLNLWFKNYNSNLTFQNLLVHSKHAVQLCMAFSIIKDLVFDVMRGCYLYIDYDYLETEDGHAKLKEELQDIILNHPQHALNLATCISVMFNSRVLFKENNLWSSNNKKQNIELLLKNSDHLSDIAYSFKILVRSTFFDSDFNQYYFNELVTCGENIVAISNIIAFLDKFINFGEPYAKNYFDKLIKFPALLIPKIKSTIGDAKKPDDNDPETITKVINTLAELEDNESIKRNLQTLNFLHEVHYIRLEHRKELLPLILQNPPNASGIINSLVQLSKIHQNIDDYIFYRILYYKGDIQSAINSVIAITKEVKKYDPSSECILMMIANLRFATAIEKRFCELFNPKSFMMKEVDKTRLEKHISSIVTDTLQAEAKVAFLSSAIFKSFFVDNKKELGERNLINGIFSFCEPAHIKRINNNPPKDKNNNKIIKKKSSTFFKFFKSGLCSASNPSSTISSPRNRLTSEA